MSGESESGFGLRFVRKQLHALYGEAASFSFDIRQLDSEKKIRRRDGNQNPLGESKLA